VDPVPDLGEEAPFGNYDATASPALRHAHHFSR